METRIRLRDVFEAAADKTVLGNLADRTQDDVLHDELVTIKTELSDREMEPAVRRLKDFVENKTVNRVINAPDSGVDFQQAITDGKIILVDIQKGEIGTVSAQILGTLAITSTWAAVQSQITVPEAERTPFYLYIDELQNFAHEGSNLKHILAECREYGMGLWIASQYLNQLAPEMRRAVTNNCRTKIFFNPSGSEDVPRITGMLQGISRDELTGLGKYRAVIQTPNETSAGTATIFDTYPPYSHDLTSDDLQAIKNAATQPGDTRDIQLERSTGSGGSAGGETHTELLKAAKNYLEFEDDVTVNILHQDGTAKPDAHIVDDDQVAHLEAEHSTLTKPDKVLTNLERAQDKNRSCVFIVDEDNVDRLETVLEDIDDDQYRVLANTDIGVTEP